MKNEEERVDTLLQFYDACFCNCHAQSLHKGSAAAWDGDGQSTRKILDTFLREPLIRNRRIRLSRGTPKVVKQGLGNENMNVYFDRLLAKPFFVEALTVERYAVVP